jgi:hypothetical protein
MTMTAAPGYYDDGTGRRRWWDGIQWTEHYEPVAPPMPVAIMPQQQGRMANNMDVSYVRQQKGHSLTAWIFASFFLVGIPGLIYYSVSPDHYWHI